jgi:hypothetical protein
MCAIIKVVEIVLPTKRRIPMRINVHMSQELNEKINAVAASETRSVSNMIAVLVAEALKAREGESK